MTLDRLGRREEAIQAVRESIQKDMTNARAHALLAGYLEESGDLAAASKEWELANKWGVSGTPCPRYSRETEKQRN